MDKCRNYFVFVILCIYVVHSSEQSGFPASPCPQFFQYLYDGTQYYGFAQIPGSQSMKLKVILGLRAQLPSQYAGTIETFYSKEEAIREFQTNMPIRYKIMFPFQDPLPELTQLSVNDRVLCSRHFDTGNYVTEVLLEHTLYFEHFESAPCIKNQDHFPLPNSTAKPHQESTPQSEMEICGVASDRFKISPLLPAEPILMQGSWPWLVSVYINRPTGATYACGGNLVSSKLVVTTANCLRTTNRHYLASEIVIFLGRHDILSWVESGYKAVQVKEIIIHPEYMLKPDSFDADIALAVFEDRVKFSEFIRPICLWEGPNDINELLNQIGVVIGWGRDENSGNIVSSTPRRVKLPILSDATCLRSSEAYRYVSSNRTFCAGKRDSPGPCNGDSGNGMMFFRNNRWILRGLVSAALVDPITSICNSAEYIVFTDAAKFVDWVRSYMV